MCLCLDAPFLVTPLGETASFSVSSDSVTVPAAYQGQVCRQLPTTAHPVAAHPAWGRRPLPTCSQASALPSRAPTCWSGRRLCLWDGPLLSLISILAWCRLPLSEGQWVLRLHFAEIFSGIQDAGLRVFDVLVEQEVGFPLPLLPSRQAVAPQCHAVSFVQRRSCIEMSICLPWRELRRASTWTWLLTWKRAMSMSVWACSGRSDRPS